MYKGQVYCPRLNILLGKPLGSEDPGFHFQTIKKLFSIKHHGMPCSTSSYSPWLLTSPSLTSHISSFSSFQLLFPSCKSAHVVFVTVLENWLLPKTALHLGVKHIFSYLQPDNGFWIPFLYISVLQFAVFLYIRKFLESLCEDILPQFSGVLARD